MTDGEAECELLAWDSEHFGFPIARVRADTLTPERARSIDAWCEQHGVRCLYFLADGADPETSRVASAHGYRVVDHRVIARRDLSRARPQPPPAAWTPREATEEDLPELCRIAERSHAPTRFYFDGNFPADRCDSLYAAWVRRGFDDPGLRVNVADEDGELLGYHLIRGPGDDRVGEGVLMALDARHRGRGVATGLMHYAAAWMISLGARSVITTMQGRAVAVLRLHERLGYLTERVSVWHHKWFAAPDGR